jgi:hypothetical protein
MSSTGRAVLDVFPTTRAPESSRLPKNVKGGNLGHPPSGAALQVTRKAAGAISAVAVFSIYLRATTLIRDAGPP